MKKKILFAFVAILFCVFSSAQGLYSKSLSVTKLNGVWTNGQVTVESANAIASNKKMDYVQSHLHEYRNILMMTTEKMEYKGNTYYIWEIDNKKDYHHDGNPVYMTSFLVLTEAQNNLLKSISTKDISIVQIPTYTTMTMAKELLPKDLEEGIKKAIVEKNDILANTYTISARKDGEYILFVYDVDMWTHKGDPNKRTYEKLDFVDNLDGGYFKIPVEEWTNLFYR